MYLRVYQSLTCGPQNPKGSLNRFQGGRELGLRGEGEGGYDYRLTEIYIFIQ
jgi:hypothetical protein